MQGRTERAVVLQQKQAKRGEPVEENTGDRIFRRHRYREAGYCRGTGLGGKRSKPGVFGCCPARGEGKLHDFSTAYHDVAGSGLL